MLKLCRRVISSSHHPSLPSRHLHDGRQMRNGRWLMRQQPVVFAEHGLRWLVYQYVPRVRFPEEEDDFTEKEKEKEGMTELVAVCETDPTVGWNTTRLPWPIEHLVPLIRGPRTEVWTTPNGVLRIRTRSSTPEYDLSLSPLSEVQALTAHHLWFEHHGPKGDWGAWK